MDDSSPTQPKISEDQLKSMLLPLSHDLKNYLTNIYLHAQMLDKKVSSENEKKHVTKIISSIQQLDIHLSSLGEIIKTFYGDVTLKTEQVTLDTLISQLEKGLTSATVELNSGSTDIHIVTIDIMKFVKIIQLATSLFKAKTVHIAITEAKDTVEIRCTGEVNQTPPFDFKLVVTYINLLCDHMNMTYQKLTDEMLFTVKVN